MKRMGLIGVRVVLVLAVVGPLAQVSAAPVTALHVLRFLPVPNSSGVALNGLVSVIFDRPVVPLARLGSGPVAATISPPVAGQMRWLGTATWAIIPAHGLAPATTYTLQLNRLLRAIDGTALSGPASWRFSTLRPAVSAVTPANETSGVLPRVPLDLTFNVPVVHSSAQAHFALRLAPHGAPLSGTFTWRSAQTMRFTPAAPLPRGAMLLVEESAGVIAQGGPLPGTSTFRSSFAVAPAFTLLTTEPADGATELDPTNVTLNLHFTAPVDLRTAASYVHIQPALAAQFIGTTDQDTLNISGNFRPSTTYRITVAAGLRSLLGDRLPATRTIVFSTAPYQAALNLIGVGSLNTYDAYRPVWVYANVTNVSQVTIDVYRQSEAEFLRVNSPDFNRSTYTPSGLPRVAHYTRTVAARLNRTVTVGQKLALANGALLPPGYYAVFASSPQISTQQYLPLLVTRSSLTLKYGDNSVLVWANDLRSGAALGGLRVRVVDGHGNPITSGRTGSDGVFSATLRPGRHIAYSTLRAFLDRPRDTAACGSDWSDGISPYDFNLPFDPSLNRVRIYLNTDRPIYRPGQAVYLRGIVRGDNDGRYHLLPAGDRVHLVATDALQHTVVDTYLRVDTQGVVSGQFTLSAGASLGYYNLQATLSNETTSATFTVAAYKKPTFKVATRPNRGENGNYAQGQHIAVTANAGYYFGAPLPHAPVQWTVSSAATQFQPPAGYDNYTFVDPDLLYNEYQAPPNQQLASFRGYTDALGDATLHIPATLQGSPLPHAVTIEANITSPTQQQVAQQSTVIVNPAAIYVGLRPRNYLATPRVPQSIDVVALRPDGTPVAHATITLALQSRTIYSVARYDPQLGYTWVNHNRDTTLRTFTLTTDGGGHAVAQVVLPSEGEYRLLASTRDTAGNTARTAIYLYSMTPGSDTYIDWGIANNDRIALVADRRQYTVGQTAHILVPAPLRNMNVLVTLERGTILSHRTALLRGNGSVIDIPITRDDLPNVYVGVTLFAGSASTRALPVWKIGYTTLVVNPLEHTLNVQVRALTPRARPGQRVQIAIRTTDGQGRPIAADVGLSLVDAAVLALASNGNGTPQDAFYTQRPLGISTAASMSLLIDRLNITPHNGAKGGSGGAGGGGGPTAIRARFPDTGYWNPNVLTNARGEATVALTLPDNLTTWHLTAYGSTTAQSLIGTGNADLIASKPVLIEPALPRFLTVRDRSALGAVVSNITNEAVTLTMRGTIRSRAGVAALPPQPLTVPPHADGAVYWPYVPQAEGAISITLYANASTRDRSDAVATTLPVEENSLVSVEAAATGYDMAGATSTQLVRLPGAIEPGEGDLRITLEPSLVAGLAPAGDYLLSYPYSCAEQATSRLTGLLALASLPPRTFGLSAVQARVLPGLIVSTKMLLYSMQGSDGGWGWWTEDPSDPFMSAYAYEGLIFLRDSGYTVDNTVLANASNYLLGRLAAPNSDPYHPDDATRALILYALARAGAPDTAGTAALYERRAALGPGPRAELAMALAAAFGARDPRVHELIAELSDAARLTSVDAHWDAGNNADWTAMETSETDTALVLHMLVTLDPRNPLVPRAVRWLMAQRGGAAAAPVETPAYDAYGNPQGAWESTEATATALRALALYALHGNDVHPAYSYRLLVNGTLIGQGTVTPSSAGQTHSYAVSTDLLRAAGGRARVQIIRQALPGGPALAATPLHYTLRLRYYPVPGSIGAVDSGISLTRRYLTHAGAPLKNGAPAGSTLTVELHLIAPQDLSRVLIEDPLPAGAEAVDGTLLTTSVFAQPGGGPDGSGPTYQYAPPQPGQPQDLGLYIDHTELRDDRTALFASFVPAGSYIYRYTIHLTTPGIYHILPASAIQVYEPEVFGHTAEQTLVSRQL